MKRPLIGITGRVDRVESYKESRVGLDLRWFDFMETCHCNALLIPYQKDISYYLELADGFLLTGGGDIAAVSQDSNVLLRDSLEATIIKYAQAAEKPLLGVCRGMQFLNHFYGGTLKPVSNHTAVRHTVTAEGVQLSKNSYHNWAIDVVGDSFEVWATSEDGTVEGVRCPGLLGIMWHPEREEVFNQDDITLVKEFLCKL